MKFQTSRSYVALLAFALMGGSLVASPTGAQQATPDAAISANKSITLSLQNVSIRTALRTLFTSAGVQNYVVDPDVQGFVNVQVSDVPLNLALPLLLRSVQPALGFTIDNGTYHVTLRQAAPSVPVSAPPTQVALNAGGEISPTTGSTTNQPLRYYPIPINKYDSFYIASLLGALGIVRVDVNGVLPSQFSGGGGNGQGGQGGFGTNQGGFGTNQGGFGGQGGGFGGQGGGYGGGRGGRGGRGGGYGGG